MMRTPRSLFLLCSLLLCGAPAAQPFPYQDASLSPEQRADDLLGRLSLQQKVSLMMNASPAIPEFGIREYNWWSEALHGAARAGLATVFPQAIGMAASWDEALLEEVFDITSTEQRIKYIQYRKNPQGTRTGDLRRGPLPHRPHGLRRGQGPAGARFHQI